MKNDEVLSVSTKIFIKMVEDAKMLLVFLEPSLKWSRGKKSKGAHTQQNQLLIGYGALAQ